LPESTFAAFPGGGSKPIMKPDMSTRSVVLARSRRRMVERVLTHCATDRKAAEPLLILLRRFATESAREEARMFCDELMAEEAQRRLQHDLAA